MKPSILRSLFCTALGAAFTLAPLTTMAETPLEKGEKFLAENKTKEGVKTTASGLQYKIVKEGTGNTPKATDRVLVHYEGKLLDGTVFDSSIKRGEPIAFPLNRVIPGWTEGLQLIKEGGKAILYIPSKLAYGPGGTPGGPIGPNETLIFEVELLKIQ
jgi:FKBP-type peptidyl-prolyl cis-trans isomerase